MLAVMIDTSVAVMIDRLIDTCVTHMLIDMEG